MTRNPLERQSAEGMCAQLTLGHGAHEARQCNCTLVYTGNMYEHEVLHVLFMCVYVFKDRV